MTHQYQSIQEAIEMGKQEEIERQKLLEEYKKKKELEKLEMEKQKRQNLEQQQEAEKQRKINYNNFLKSMNPSKILFESICDQLELAKPGDEIFNDICKNLKYNPERIIIYDHTTFNFDYGGMTIKFNIPRELLHLYEKDYIYGCPYLGYTHNFTNPELVDYQLVGYYSLFSEYQFRIDLRKKPIGLFSRLLSWLNIYTF